MTPEEHRDAIISDPEKYFSAVNEQGNEQLDQMFNNFLSSIQGNVNAAYSLLKLSGEELSIFRALEVEMRYGKLTTERMEHYAGRLGTFRDKIRQQHQEHAAARKGK